MNEAPLVSEPAVPSAPGSVPAPFQPRMQGGFREKVAGLLPVAQAARWGLRWPPASCSSSPASAWPAPSPATVPSSGRSSGRRAIRPSRSSRPRGGSARRWTPSRRTRRRCSSPSRGSRSAGTTRRASGCSPPPPPRSRPAARTGRGPGRGSSPRRSSPTTRASWPAQEARLAADARHRRRSAAGGRTRWRRSSPRRPSRRRSSCSPAPRSCAATGPAPRPCSTGSTPPPRARPGRPGCAPRAVTKGDDKAARAILEAAVAKDPANAAAALDLAALLERAGDPAAEAALRGAPREGARGPARTRRAGPGARCSSPRRWPGAATPTAPRPSSRRAAQDWAGATDARVALGRLALRTRRSRQGHRRARGHPGRDPDGRGLGDALPGAARRREARRRGGHPRRRHVPFRRTTPTCSS